MSALSTNSGDNMSKYGVKSYIIHTQFYIILSTNTHSGLTRLSSLCYNHCIKVKELVPMSALNSDFTGCSVFFYDDAGNNLGNTTVIDYNKKALRIEVPYTPPSLTVGSSCKLLILSSPSPCEYQGRVAKEGAKKIIALFFGHEKENRRSVRYKVNIPALIENMIYDNRAYPLHTPLEIELVNISQSGMRFRAPFTALSDDDRFQIRLRINKSEKLLIADVVYHIDKGTETSEYGCRFLIGSERAVEP